MNEDKLREIIIEFKPKNFLIHEKDYLRLLKSNIDFVTNIDMIMQGNCATCLESQLWVKWSPVDIVNENFIKFSLNDSRYFNEIEWSLPICLDWHLNDIRKMWSLKAFW